MVIMSITIKLSITVIDAANYLFELVDHGDPNFTAICTAFIERLQIYAEVKHCPETLGSIKAFMTTDLPNHEFLAKADELFQGAARAFDRGHHHIKTWGGECLFEEPSSGPAELLPSARHFLKLW